MASGSASKTLLLILSYNHPEDFVVHDRSMSAARRTRNSGKYEHMPASYTARIMRANFLSNEHSNPIYVSENNAPILARSCLESFLGISPSVAELPTLLKLEPSPFSLAVPIVESAKRDKSVSCA